MKNRIMFMLSLLILAPTLLNAGNGDIKLDVKSHTFDNGLELLVVERHLSPTVSTFVRFKVGSADERPGITGAAHLLEHMLFKGTKNIGTANYEAEVPLMEQIDKLAHELTDAIVETRDPQFRGDKSKVDSLRKAIADIQAEQNQYVIKDQLWETYLRNGGSGLNASTGNDGTQYYVSLPANRMELWAYLESDRLSNPVFREFYSERDVVYEERRLRIDNSARGRLYEQFNAAAFTASPYNWPIVGWASDLETMYREDIEEFFYQYYSPNNIVLAVVGDVKFNDIVKLVEDYFGDIPPSAKPVPKITTIEPKQFGERRIEVEYDSEPRMLIGWKMLAGGDVDQEVFDIISRILSGGRTSRLYKSLVVDKKIVSSIYASSAFTRFRDTFTISATPKKGYSIEEVESAIYKEIEKLKNEGPSDWELERVHNQLDANFVKGLRSNGGLAYRIADMQAKTGDWSYLITLKEKRKAVTSEDIKRVVSEYFIDNGKTVAYLVKPESEVENTDQSGLMAPKKIEAVAK